MITREKRGFNVVFSASAEEEVSGKNGIELLLPRLPHVDAGIIGEPTGLQPAVAEKGLMVIDVTSYGRSGHAARDEGDNAIYKAVEDIRWITDHEFAKVSPLLGKVKATVTTSFPTGAFLLLMSVRTNFIRTAKSSMKSGKI